MANRTEMTVRRALNRSSNVRGRLRYADLRPSMEYMYTVLHKLFLSKDMLIQNILGFLAARAGVLAGLHPFGPALFIAMLTAGGRKNAVVIGMSVALGSLTVLPLERSLPLIITIIVCLFLFKNASVVPVRESASNPVANWQQIVIAATIFWLCRIAFQLPYGVDEYKLVSATLEAFIAALLSFILTPLACFEWSRPMRRFEQKVWIALALLAAVAGLGFYSFEWGWIRPIEVWIRWITMMAASIGSAGAGASVGTLAGVLLSLAGGSPLGGQGLYGVAGLFAGLAAKKGRIGVALGFILGQVLVSVLATSAEEVSFGLSHTGLAILLMLVTPGQWVSRLGRLIPGSKEHQHMVMVREERIKAAINDKLHRLSSLFDEMATVFSDTIERPGKVGVRDENGLQRLTESVWKIECQQCDGFQRCWQQDAYRSYWDLVDLVTTADRQGGRVSSSDLPAGLASRCTRPTEFVRAVNTSLNSVHQRDDQKSAGTDFVPRQLAGIAELIENAAGQVRIDTGRAEEIEAYLKHEPGLRIEDGVELTVIKAGDRPEVEVVFDGECDGHGQCTQIIVDALERATGKNYGGTSLCRKKTHALCHLRLRPMPPHSIELQAVYAAQEGKGVSGDSFVRFDLDEGKEALLLSDGMGTGTSAKTESSATIGLLEKMMRAGFDQTFAARTVNTALLNRSSRESFATVDLVIIDKFTGETQFLKGGSSATFIKRPTRVDVIRSTSLPVGIVGDIDVQADRTILGLDDVLVMMTDGLLDMLPHDVDKEEWMIRLLKGESTKAPDKLARVIIDRAEQLSSSDVTDDVTVVVARLKRRPLEEGEIPVYTRAAP